MQFLDLFHQQHVHDVLESTFSYSDKSNVSFAAEKCEDNKDLTLLNVKIEQKFVLVKIPENSEPTEQHPVKNSKVLYPVFILKDSTKQCYGAYGYRDGLEQLVSPKENNLECVKIILKNLAEHQALELTSGKPIEKPSEYSLKDITETVASLDFFNGVDKAVILQSIENSQVELNKLLEESDLFVRSIGCPLAKNVFVNQDQNESVFLTVPSTKIALPAYDALLYIFALSDEQFRQEHFQNLVSFYGKSLNKFLQELKSNIADKINKSYIEHQVRVLLPVVKFKIISSRLKLANITESQDILNNLLNFLKHPLINQEDIYEVIKNKTGCSDFVLLGYNLVALSSKNGHLGEYYHLNIEIKAEEKEQELQLFAKILKPPEGLEKLLTNYRLANKEDFFYQTLLPLYAKYGLDSLLDFAPKCYLSRPDWIIVLDDLSRQGYVSLKPNTDLPFEGLRANIENLAKLHACSIILEEILSEKSGKPVRLDQDYGEFLQEVILIYDDDRKADYDKTLELYIYIAEKYPEITEKLNVSPEEFKARFQKAFLSVFSKVKKSDTIRNVISHGDMYIGNMLFKHGDDKIIQKAMLIDFQVLRYVPSSYELLFFLYENCTKQTRDKHFTQLIEEYYRLLSEHIKKFNFNPEDVFPKKAFDNNINFMKSAAVIGALNYAHMIHIDPDLREEIFHDREKMVYYMVEHKEELVDLSLKAAHYENMVKGLLEDIVDIIQTEF